MVYDVEVVGGTSCQDSARNVVSIHVRLILDGFFGQTPSSFLVNILLFPCFARLSCFLGNICYLTYDVMMIKRSDKRELEYETGSFNPVATSNTENQEWFESRTLELWMDGLWRCFLLS